MIITNIYLSRNFDHFVETVHLRILLTLVTHVPHKANQHSTYNGQGHNKPNK